MKEFMLAYPFAVVVISFFVLWAIINVIDSITKIWRKKDDGDGEEL